MNYALTLDVVALAEQFHYTFEQVRLEGRFDEIIELRNQTCAILTPNAEALFRRLTSLDCLRARPNLAEHFLDGTLYDVG
jgi:hypothetical protein